jgi:hypothetical protein
MNFSPATEWAKIQVEMKNSPKSFGTSSHGLKRDDGKVVEAVHVHCLNAALSHWW